MNKPFGFAVLVITFIMITIFSLDQPYIIDFVEGVEAVEQSDDLESTEQKEDEDDLKDDEQTTAENDDDADAADDDADQSGAKDNKSNAGTSKIYQIKGESKNLNEEQLGNMKKWRSDIVKFAGNHPGLIYINGYTGKKMVCLTFDDGPDGEITPQVLNILKRYHVKASFFFVGNKIEQYPEIINTAYQEGHLVLSHTWSHRQLNAMEEQEIRREVEMSEDKIYELIGERPAFIRPPYGEVDEKVARAIKNRGGKIILWSIDTLDWSQKEKNNIVKNVTEHVRPGDIILMHCDSDKTETVKALPEIITILRQKGYQFVDLGEMLQINPYK
jgi:peptidoglycan/xylan/chitin deacetylase (PgdA/CDA1 family)